MKPFTIFHAPEGPSSAEPAAPAAPAPSTANAPGAESSQQDQHEAEELAVETLTDSQLEEKITGKPTPPATPTKEGEAPTPAAAPVDDRTKVGPVTPAPAPDYLYAGKYKTVDDLKKGLLEIAKPLNYNPKILERIIQIAEKTGDWKPVEETYADLNLTLSQNQKATPPAPPATVEPPQPAAPATDTELAAQQETTRVIVNETFREIANSQIAQDLAEQGLELPTTKEQFAQLKIDYPYLAIKWDQEFTRLFHSIRNDVQAYQQSLEGVETHNAAAIESAKTQISDFVKEYKLEGISQPEITKAIEDAMKSDFVFEPKAGVPYLRENGLLEYFLAKEFPKLAKIIKTNGELDGRTQHAEDLQAMREKTVRSISTAKLPGSQARRETPAINPEDEQQIAALSDEDIEKLLKSGKQ
jgi:hypothetical protein